MYAREDAVPDVAAHVLPAEAHDLRAARARGVGEERDGGLRGELHQHGDGGAEGDGDHRGVAQRETRALRLARAEVLRAERGDGGEHRRGHEEEEAHHLFDDADGGRVVQPAHVDYYRDYDEGNLYEAVLERYRDADFQYLPHDGALRPQVAARDGDSAFAARYDEERERYARGLRERRRERRALRPHAEASDEKIVERDVRGAGGGYEVHRAFRVAEAAEYRADYVVGGDEGDAREADFEVGRRAAHGVRGRGHDGDDFIREREEHDCERKRERHEERDGVAYSAGGAPAVSRADRAPYRDGRAHREADYHDGQHVHHLRAYRDCRDVRDAAELSRDEEVRHSVERLQEVG